MPLIALFIIKDVMEDLDILLPNLLMNIISSKLVVLNILSNLSQIPAVNLNVTPTQCIKFTRSGNIGKSVGLTDSPMREI